MFCRFGLNKYLNILSFRLNKIVVSGLMIHYIETYISKEGVEIAPVDVVSLLDINRSIVDGIGKSDHDEICDNSETLLLSTNCFLKSLTSGSSTLDLTKTGAFIESGSAF